MVVLRNTYMYICYNLLKYHFIIFFVLAIIRTFCPYLNSPLCPLFYLDLHDEIPKLYTIFITNTSKQVKKNR